MSQHSIDTHDLIDDRPRSPEELIDAARIVGRDATCGPSGRLGIDDSLSGYDRA